MEKGDDAKGVTLSQMKNQLCHSLKDKRLSDSRLSLAVAAKRSNPHMSLVDALLAGGFKFHQLGADVCDKDILDPGGVSLFTWKNELRKKLTAWERSDCSKRKMDGLVPMGGGDEEVGKPEQSKKRGCKNQSSLTTEQQLTAQHDNIWHNNRRPDILLAHSDEDEDNGQCAHHEGIKRSTSFDKDIEELPGLDELPVGFKDDFTMVPGFWGLEGMN
uniref:Uncharacterized protein n=1 Tax=Pseudictyota dubia TaxID=2749911 RepID=A0A7R9Z7E2_9STRA|mmetsp:Transcript_25450/g.47382  ORF Transcript_25450/g.47382 Transcript_25450/m.47382 type:complete len:216 (+) Transcript_25450:3-650(+)